MSASPPPVETLAAALGIRLEPEWIAGVAGYYQLAAQLAATLEAVDLPPGAEPLPDYLP
jgi:hypothetical protein